MKKNVLVLVLAAALLMSLLAGCGAATKETVSNGFSSPEMMDMSAEMGNGIYDSTDLKGTNTPSAATDQKLVRRVNLSVETEDLDTLLEQISTKLSQLGGYMEQQQLNNGSSYSSYRSRSASLTIRIPADRLDDFVQQVKGISNVVRFNQSTENITLSYVATESRMKALQTEEARLLELLAKAENMSDLLEIEQRLTDVRYELESITSQLRVMQNQVDYATVNLNIDQVRVYTEVEPQSVWQRIGSGLRSNLSDLKEGLLDFFVWVVTYSPQLIVLAGVIAIVRVLVRRRKNKKRAASAPKQDNSNP